VDECKPLEPGGAFSLARAAMSAALMEELTRWRKSEAARLGDKPAYVGKKRDHDLDIHMARLASHLTDE